ncbi:MAG: hypothetical protein GXP55_23105 [Deltaproteobacteria bacterium]|nr:hypothetical protein [Deltaproteobacteria bacterium]
MPSGIAALDAVLAHGGLRAGEVLRFAGHAGALSLGSSWAREASRRGEPVLVIDARTATLPHAWIEPPEATAPIWVISPRDPAEAWPALDVGLRSGAFGLALLIDPCSAPRGAGPRLMKLLRQHHGRLLLLGEPRLPRARTLEVWSLDSRWDESPLGATPARRRLAAREGAGPVAEIWREDTLTDRLRPAPRVADRRAAQHSSKQHSSKQCPPREPHT